MKLDAALIGLLGVFVGAILAVMKDWWFHRARQKEERAYLAIQISCLLERFVSGCLDVVNDDGLFQGQRDSQGCLSVQVSAPQFEPLQIDVNWKCLPASLMYSVLRFPSKVDDANAYISAVWEFAASPPDYDELFEARIEKFSELGLLAISLTDELRRLAKLPISPLNDEWDPKEELAKANHQVKMEIESRVRRQQGAMRQMSTQKQGSDSSGTTK
ncbi:hypothetical protein GCM10011369_29910 [Neiella marina]|uniref:Uncharacterized protein n=1 Tax=Neiella marina TaxID=508461 RepID=A0A8J2U8B6_9GAMM|nr:hypothetical protein [Neiella marina]GGA85888.1 hypothetical protein GCM10011369_29910 [Neiella marina]